MPTACRQISGHYIGGATGLENGTAAPPGAYSTFFPVVERANALKGPNGKAILKLDVNVVANLAAFALTVNKKILGGTYGWSLILL